jgi:hypothetical protein
MMYFLAAFISNLAAGRAFTRTTSGKIAPSKKKSQFPWL